MWASSLDNSGTSIQAFYVLPLLLRERHSAERGSGLMMVGELSGYLGLDTQIKLPQDGMDPKGCQPV